MPQDSSYCMNNLENFSINLNVDYSQSETTDSNFDKEATPQQIQASVGQLNKRHQWIAMVEN